MLLHINPTRQRGKRTGSLARASGWYMTFFAAGVIDEGGHERKSLASRRARSQTVRRRAGHRPRLLTKQEQGFYMGIHGKTRLVRAETRISHGERLTQSSRRLLDSRRRDNMMNRLGTALVSVTAVAVAMMVLGSNARAKSVRTASPQKYVRFLQGLAEGEIKSGTSLIQRYSSLERTINRLENTPHPRPRLAREIAAEIATDSKQESGVVASLQKNTNALLATQADLQALPPQEKAQVSNLLNSIQTLVVSEKGVATPVR